MVEENKDDVDFVGILMVVYRDKWVLVRGKFMEG